MNNSGFAGVINSGERQFSWWAAALSLAFGFLPFLIFSLWTNTFSLTSPVAVPLALSPSILIGDSVIIPLFNGLAFPIIANLATRSIQMRNQISMTALGGLLLSTPLNVYLHVLWSRDEYTGFIDPTRGRLSLGGQWHCAFASLELAFVLTFVTTCLLYRNWIAPAQVWRAWRVFVLYTAMSIFDAGIMLFVVGRPVTRMRAADYTAATPFFLAIISCAPNFKNRLQPRTARMALKFSVW